MNGVLICEKKVAFDPKTILEINIAYLEKIAWNCRFGRGEISGRSV